MDFDFGFGDFGTKTENIEIKKGKLLVLPLTIHYYATISVSQMWA